MAIKNGTSGNDTINGTSSADTINGLGGNDILKGLGGNDLIHGNDGNDTIDGGSGNNSLYGDAGNDLFYVNQGIGFGLINGGTGTDTISFAQSAQGAIMKQFLASGYSFASVENFTGSNFNDTLVGTAGNNTIRGGSGSDTITASDGNDIIYGDAGIDNMFGGNGNDTFYFSDFTDHIDGGAGQDTISFQKLTHGVTLDNNSWNEVSGSVTAVEKITGSEYADTIEQGGDPFTVTIEGKGGNDHLTGDENTKVYGGNGNDNIDMGPSVTDISKIFAFGGSGNDTLFAKEMTGNSGSDTFILDYTYATHFGPANANAIIHDFQPGFDHILFRGPVPIESDGLTHNGDVWTVHSPDPDFQNGNEDITFNVSYTIDGITALQASDYSFDIV